MDIPSSVRAIRNEAFYNCSALTTAILNNGLEVIGGGAFKGCALVRIDIPPSVREIDETAFKCCSNLSTVRFCDDIEEFVFGESMRHWWNHGVHEKCLSTYCLLVRFNIPERLGLVWATQRQDSIHGMLMRIPFISKNGMDSYFRSMDSKLSAYEGSTMLELAIWKSKIVEQTDGVIYPLDADLKMACRIDSLTMVGIVVPNVLSFLRCDANEGEDDDNKDRDDDGDGDDDNDDDDDDDDADDDDADDADNDNDNDADDDGDDDDSEEDDGDGDDEY